MGYEIVMGVTFHKNDPSFFRTYINCSENDFGVACSLVTAVRRTSGEGEQEEKRSTVRKKHD